MRCVSDVITFKSVEYRIGSGNALAKSVDTPYADLAALNIIKGITLFECYRT